MSGNSDGETVMAFLNRHADRPIKATRVSYYHFFLHKRDAPKTSPQFQSVDDDTIIVSVEHAGQMVHLLKLDGIRYAGSKVFGAIQSVIT